MYGKRGAPGPRTPHNTPTHRMKVLLKSAAAGSPSRACDTQIRATPSRAFGTPIRTTPSRAHYETPTPLRQLSNGSANLTRGSVSVAPGSGALVARNFSRKDVVMIRHIYVITWCVLLLTFYHVIYLTPGKI